MKKILRSTSLLLVLLMVCGSILISCGGQIETSETNKEETTKFDSVTSSEESVTQATIESSKAPEFSEKESVSDSEAVSTLESDPETSEVTEDEASSTESSVETSAIATETDTEESDEPIVTEYQEILDYEGSKIVEYADYIKDGSNAAYLDPKRSYALVENMNMTLVHGVNGNLMNSGTKNRVASISNKDGGVYVSDTMEAFVRTTDGKTYFASDWMTGCSFNVLRGGYYYQEARIQDQGFGDVDAILENAVDIDVSRFVSTSTNQVTDLAVGEDGILSYTIVNTGKDPGIETKESFEDLQISSKVYNALLITMKTEQAFVAELFFKTHKMNNYNSSFTKMISLIPGDDYHTYVVRLDDLSSFNGFLTGFRMDVGTFNGERINIQSVKAVNIDENVVPIRLDRGLHAYSDKLHQELHFVATGRTKDVAAYGMVTEIAENTVDKLIVKDKNGEHKSLDGVDWASAEYIAFDIKDVGVFGYIIANDAVGGSMTVTLENGAYKIVQERLIESGAYLNKGDDLYVAHRIYTDASHSFAAFRREAYIERNPLGEENIVVEYDNMNQATFVGYDYLRGAYKLTMKGTGFSNAYYTIWNRHYTASITVKGDSVNRRLYLYSSAKTGGLECAAVLNKEQMMLPIPLQVIKNFAGDGEHSIFVNDVSYSETYMPVKADANSSQSFSLLNLYQNWGKQPLKQLSWIQFASPYYHISTGVTETNCIMPMYGGGPSWKLVHDPTVGNVYEFFVVSGKGLSTLPDFRAMSGILWKDQPQHNSCMEIKWLEYWTKQGEHITSDFVDDKIASYGPTYADITLDYISDDGKIEASYRHAEMPQTDETRTYYTIRLDIKDTINIDSFRNNFNIFETNSRFGPYQYIGYLNENGEQVVEESDRSGERRFITLGKENPYFGYFYYYLQPNSNMCNYAVIIKDWDIVLGGERYDGSFLIEERFLNSLNYTRFTLDIDDITLEEGDYIDINMILLPWGKANATEDLNVRQVRQDSCIAPYKVEASVGDVIADDFIPMVNAKNNIAEFTFSGGHNNGVVRVYGFDILTSPTIYEFVDGEWKIYEVNSISVPDKNENAHYYDGYCVHYDGNGLYSYSFVIPTEQGAERRFKVVAEEFKGYPEDPSPEIPDPPTFDPSDSDSLVDPNEARPEGKGAPVLYFSAQDLYLITKKADINTHMLDVAALSIEGEMKFARYMTYGMENQDAYIVLYSNTDEALDAAPFIGIKYRTKTPNASMEFWINSEDIGYFPGENNAHIGTVNDEEWHYAILDLRVSAGKHFDGKGIHLLRFDFLNSSTPALPANSSIDIAYIGFFTSEEEAGKFEYGDEFKTQEQIKNENNALCVDPESGYTLSDKVYGNNLDFINGEKVTWDAGNSKYGVSVINYNGNTLDDGRITIAGWTVVDGGIAKYIWSADGGKTWYKTTGDVGHGAVQAHFNVITGKIGAYKFSTGTAQNSTYQTAAGQLGGRVINLSSYKGQTVDVVFAVVPANDPRAICPLILLKNVTVTGESTPDVADELLPEIDNRTDEEKKADNNAGLVAADSGYTVSDLVYGANLDFINAKTLTDQGGNSRLGCSHYTDEITTFSNGRVVLTGWTVVDGGIKDYVYSLDGGKTWTVIPGDPGNGAGTAHFNVLKGRIGEYAFSEGSNIKSTFGGSQAQGENIAGLGINLSAYAGQTISVTFAAIPRNDEDGLCLIAHLEKVKVVTSN